MNASARQEETVKVIKWIGEYSDLADRLIADDFDREHCIEFLRMLRQQELDYLIPLFLEKLKHYRIEGNAIDRLYSDGLAILLEQCGTGVLIDRLDDYIRQESLKHQKTIDSPNRTQKTRPPRSGRKNR